MMAIELNGKAPTRLDILDGISRERPLSPAEEAQLARALRTRFGDTKSGGKWHWTRGEVGRLKRYLERGKRPAQIAPLLGRTERAIWRRIYREGWTVRAAGKCSIALPAGK